MPAPGPPFGFRGTCTARAVAGTAQLHRPGTATSPSTQLRVQRSPGASAGILGLEGAAGCLHPALAAARSLNGMRAASPRDPGRRGAPERPGLHAPTEDHPESTAVPNGGSRAMPAASDSHAARLAFQSMSVLIDSGRPDQSRAQWGASGHVCQIWAHQGDAFTCPAVIWRFAEAGGRFCGIGR